MTQAVPQAPLLEELSHDFFPVLPSLALRSNRGNFDIYIRCDDTFALYAKAGDSFTEHHETILLNNGRKSVYIRRDQRPEFFEHLVTHLGETLLDESIPRPARAQIFYETSLEIVEEIFTGELPPSLDRGTFDRVFEFVTKGVSFLTLENSLQTMGSIIAHDYQTYSHSLHVFVYSQLILQTYGFEERDLVQFGLGAILHDIGKKKIPEAILTKPGKLSTVERQYINTHPVHGAGICASLPLSQDALNCILFHHEKLDGSGYPCGLKDEDIPLPVRAVTIADIYDAIRSTRPYSEGTDAFRTLRIMKEEMATQIDMNVFRRFIRILSGNSVI
ncbi:HD-GYP domain-containing protein [Halodesulfovibrio spirochaetisodalis]|uniref:HD family phosphohydrolase n=1 Tax=Halodesulfovibrio spirochaetisodalis TaxID=1560234 RepID=A0A1B7XN06_9BACT|nr:HD domain-containing phosphohydrolase [Halodesulfovibrio spirochaetisodalis]OBQ56902.1 HD family phosphohydrolase [Halodesulfovibrio spirochaetisodalis]